MRYTRTLILAGLIVVTLALVAAGCGGQLTTTTAQGVTTTAGPTATTQAVTTTGAPTTTQAVTTTAGAAGGAALEAYRTAMKAWFDKYDAKMSAAADSLATALQITDPSAVTDAQMKQIEDFVALLKDFTADLAKITPPSDLAAAHATYVDGYQRLTTSLEQIVAALKAKDAAAMLTAAGAVLKVVQDPAVPEAESAIEAALGFSLSSQ